MTRFKSVFAVKTFLLTTKRFDCKRSNWCFGNLMNLNLSSWRGKTTKELKEFVISTSKTFELFDDTDIKVLTA